jgi:t-SNARE complex subunit (syntaxin)
MILEEGENTLLRDRQRERMVTQINELGQIVSDLSMHISLQGENLKRIDDVVEHSDDFIRKSIYEVNRTWESISGRRRTILKFFMFWTILAVIFWGVKRL